MLPKIKIISAGGTIACKPDEKGASPRIKGKELLETVPGVQDYAEISVKQPVLMPSYDMDKETVVDISQNIKDAFEAGSEGIVITQGTDTMEESAYFLDLILDIDAPVVLTGAQRRPDETSPDGPSNLLTAVRTAGHDRLLGKGGVYIAFNEELHAARDVTKSHTYKLEAFESPEKGPVASVAKDRIRFHREPGSKSINLPVSKINASVAMIKSGIGVDGKLIEHAIQDGIDGIVIEGTGLGNTTTEVSNSVKKAIDADIPVVMTSRCNAGPVIPIYGSLGGGKTLHELGVISGGDLSAHKARIKLMLALSITQDIEEIQGFFLNSY